MKKVRLGTLGVGDEFRYTKTGAVFTVDMVSRFGFHVAGIAACAATGAKHELSGTAKQVVWS